MRLKLKNRMEKFIKEKYETIPIDKKKELGDIFNKTFFETDAEKTKQKNNLLESLDITCFIDDGVFIGKNLIRDLLPKIKFSHVITDKNVLDLFKDYFNENEVFLIDKINGKDLRKIIFDIVNDLTFF